MSLFVCPDCGALAKLQGAGPCCGNAACAKLRQERLNNDRLRGLLERARAQLHYWEPLAHEIDASLKGEIG
jgi:hypothetical protein